MIKVFGLVLVAAVLSLFLLKDSPSVRAETPVTPVSPVLVELFTSEGCSSCPPADRVLREMQEGKVPEGVRVVLMGEHVDYWNALGWKDRFSSAEFTARQARYVRNLRLASAYTPQAIVDGEYDIVGNDRSGLWQAITTASARPKPARIDLKMVADRLRISVTGAPNSHVQWAVTEDGLVTNVKGGENGGRQLQHAAVLRSLQELGNTAPNGTFDGEFPIQLGADWMRSRLHIIVIAQQENGKVLGVAAINPQ